LVFKIGITDSPVLLKLIPEIKSLEPILISGSLLNSALYRHKCCIPNIIYGENTITNALMSVDNKRQGLVYNLTIDDIQNKLIQLPYSGFWESSGQY
jgi:hypothetical protein